MFLLQLIKHAPRCKIDEFASLARRNQRNVKSASSQEQLPGLKKDDQTLPVSFYKIEIFCPQQRESFLAVNTCIVKEEFYGQI